MGKAAMAKGALLFLLALCVGVATSVELDADPDGGAMIDHKQFAFGSDGTDTAVTKDHTWCSAKWTKDHMKTYVEKQAMALALCHRGAQVVRSKCKKKSGKEEELGESMDALEKIDSAVAEMQELSTRDSKGKSKIRKLTHADLIKSCKRGTTALAMCNRAAMKIEEKCGNLPH